METLPVGTVVRIQRQTPGKGTFDRYVGREGTIVTVNSESTIDHVEYGVNFGLKKDASRRQVDNARAEAWFLRTEIHPMYVVHQLPEPPTRRRYTFPSH